MNLYVSPFQDLAFLEQCLRSHPSRHELKRNFETELRELTLPKE